MTEAHQLFLSGASYNDAETICTANSLAFSALASGNQRLARYHLRGGLKRTSNRSAEQLQKLISDNSSFRSHWYRAHTELFTLELQNLQIPQACAHFMVMHSYLSNSRYSGLGQAFLLISSQDYMRRSICLMGIAKSHSIPFAIILQNGWNNTLSMKYLPVDLSR